MQRLHRKNLIWLLCIVLLFLALQAADSFGFLNSSARITLIDIMLNVIFALGLNLILGVAGQFSLGHAGFIAIGSYATAILTKQIPGWGGFWLSLLVGMVIAMIVALIVGVPTLRLRGDYLAIATLGISEIIRVIINNWRDVTNGPAGINNIARLTTWQLTYGLMILVALVVLNYTFSSQGRATLAINQDEIAAEAMGVNVTKYKVLAFVIGAATAAVGGSLKATLLGVVTPGDYTFDLSIEVLIIVVFGGIGSFTGSFIAAIALGILNMLLRPYGQLRMVIYAAALILIMIFKPGGLLGRSEWKLGSLISNWFPESKKEEVGS